MAAVKQGASMACALQIFTKGKTEKAALANLKKAAELYLESFPEARPRTA